MNRPLPPERTVTVIFAMPTTVRPGGLVLCVADDDGTHQDSYLTNEEALDLAARINHLVSAQSKGPA